MVLLNEVPLVHQNHDTPVAVYNLPENRLVLTLHTVLCIDEEQAHIALFNASDGADGAVKFQLVFDLLFAPQSRCIDQLKVESVQVEVGVYAVARGARNVCDDVPFVAHQRVDERALTHIGTSNHSKLGQAAVLLISLIGQQCHQSIQEVPRTVAA